MLKLLSASLCLATLICFSSVHASPSHDDYAYLWNNVLEQNVATDEVLQGVPTHTVNYAGVIKNSNFSEYVSKLKTVKTSGLSKDGFYSLFINVYNSFAIKLIADHPCNLDPFGDCGGPLTGIKELGFLPFGSLAIWKKKVSEVGDTSYSLDAVEGMLREPWSFDQAFKEDPRLHAAIVCASISCPNLQKTAYTTANLDAQLNYTWNNWLNNTKKGMAVDSAAKKITLSSIFNWFSSDFVNVTKRLRPDITDPKALDFIMIYLDQSHPDYAWLKSAASSGSYNVSFFDYNWDANAQKGSLICTKDRVCFPFWALMALVCGVALVIIIVVIVVCCIRRRRRKYILHYDRLNEF